ncbi:ANTAR domain-containing response regulator [Pseudaminobacter soli (ex Li et al. 2025)]|uniref:ANTAR domain-containing protein n=1 Tax=Pseudaminobacter soli (ex Li et al. 2025) TaxID=1295366 RepID=A0A2P7RXV4_9HYPH|nr:ANTAR domain-containing protein [Mesorhizobium soli]PSJ55044.1 ANTAR domain-containing protein [Mesorhizobium soli]
MNDMRPTPSFVGWRALVVHQPHPNVDALLTQFERIGVAASHYWPEITDLPELDRFNVVLIDADMGYDDQFPWKPGGAPIPVIALIGSEAPGRVSWAMRQGADAQMLKPIGSAGLYSALVAASHGFERRQAMTSEIAALRARLESRELLAEATAILMVRDNISAKAAFQKLRLTAMAERMTLETMAARLVETISDMREAL